MVGEVSNLADLPFKISSLYEPSLGRALFSNNEQKAKNWMAL